MADGKARNGRRAALGLALAAAVWLFGVWPPPLWWRDHWPRQTAMMRWTARHVGGAAGARYHPTQLAQLSSHLQRTVVLAEDWRFREHPGIDFAEIRLVVGVPQDAGAWQTLRAAWHQRARIRGASTITQQLAKNLYLSPSRSPVRKLKEAVTALWLDFALSKDRILEIYLNVVEWGPGLWGAEQASRAYFEVAPAELDLWQAASLAATLPHPRTSNPAYRPGRMAARRELILALYHGADVVIPPSELPEEPDFGLETPPLMPPTLDSLLADTIVIRGTGEPR